MRLLPLFLLLICFAGCKPLSKMGLENHRVTPVTGSEFTRLNGLYRNVSDTVDGRVVFAPYGRFDDTTSVDLLGHLYYNVPWKKRAWGDSTSQIALEFQSPTKVNVSLYKADTLVKTWTLKGKFKKGFFYLRPRVWAAPFIPVFFGYNFERAAIGISAGGLVLKYTINYWAFALVAGSSEVGSVSAFFKEQQPLLPKNP